MNSVTVLDKDKAMLNHKRYADGVRAKNEPYGNYVYARYKLGKIIKYHETDLRDSCYKNSWLFDHDKARLQPYNCYQELEEDYRILRSCTNLKTEMRQLNKMGERLFWYAFYVAHYAHTQYTRLTTTFGLNAIEFMEFVQEAYSLLLKMIKAYDPAKRSSFYTYSLMFIKYRLISKGITLSACLNVKCMPVFSQVMNTMMHEHGSYIPPKELSSEEFASRFGISLYSYKCFILFIRHFSLDSKINTREDSEDTDTLHNVIRDKKYDVQEQTMRNITIETFMDSAHKVIMKKFGKSSYPGQAQRYWDIWSKYMVISDTHDGLKIYQSSWVTYDQLADEYGVSRQRIEQIVSKVSSVLRHSSTIQALFDIKEEDVELFEHQKLSRRRRNRD